MSVTEEKILLPSERPREELDQALAEYERENPNKYTFVFDENDHILIESFLVENTEDWQEFVIPDFVWGFTVNSFLKDCIDGRGDWFPGVFPSSQLAFRLMQRFDFISNPAFLNNRIDLRTRKHLRLKLSGGGGLRSLNSMLAYPYKKEVNVEALDTSSVKDIRGFLGMLYHRSDFLESVTGLSKWETSNITHMDYAFYGCNNLKSIGDISQWNTENVVSMKGAFQCCPSLTLPIKIKDWKLSKQIDLFGIFKESDQLFSSEDAKLIRTQWMETVEAACTEGVFCDLIYGTKESCKELEISDFLPDLGLHSEVFLWPERNDLYKSYKRSRGEKNE